jgi:hypothetical protein
MYKYLVLDSKDSFLRVPDPWALPGPELWAGFSGTDFMNHFRPIGLVRGREAKLVMSTF